MLLPSLSNTFHTKILELQVLEVLMLSKEGSNRKGVFVRLCPKEAETSTTYPPWLEM